MNWQLLPQFAISGLLEGGPLALVALGLVLIFKSSYIFNFAQGQLLLLGTLMTWWFAVEQGMPLAVAIMLALVFSAVLGLAIERVALRPMTSQPLLSIILMTLGLNQVLQGSALFFFGGTQRNFPQIFAAGDPYRLTLPFTYNDNPINLILKQNLVWSFVIAIVGVVLITLFFQYTRTGLAMRATSEDHELAQSLGLRIERIFAISWGMAGVVATAGGILLATASGLDTSLSFFVLAAFPVVLLGGLESIPGTIVGGLLIGLARGLANTSTSPLIRSSTEIVPYVVLLIVLVLRPEGIFGQRRIERV
jgi:branched-chain amino acid transport system permease protein